MLNNIMHPSLLNLSLLDLYAYVTLKKIIEN